MNYDHHPFIPSSIKPVFLSDKSLWFLGMEERPKLLEVPWEVVCNRREGKKDIGGYYSCCYESKIVWQSGGGNMR